MQKVIQAKYGHFCAFNPVATLLVLMTLLSECCVRLLAELLTPRDHLFDGLATANGGVTTPRDHLFHGWLLTCRLHPKDRV